MEIGEKIDKYIITEVLHGGMSDVYRVIKDETQERYVIKRLKQDANEESKKLFLREMRILHKLKHENIIEIVDENYDCQCPYYVMPSCGKSLVDIASSKNEYEKIILSIQMCEGLNFMHKQNVRHRDIKPQNILIKDGIVKIADFGLSRFSERDSTTLTSTSLAAGTQGYIPPEYSLGAFKEGTIEGDIYMLGKTIYYLFSRGSDVSNVRLGNVPIQIAPIIDKATQDNPNYRYTSIQPIIDELKVYKKDIEDIPQLPKSIDDIRSMYSSDPTAFMEEIYKHIMFLSNESTSWNNSLLKLSQAELINMLNYKKKYINTIILHFIECIKNPSDFIQYNHIDVFAKFANCITMVNTDVITNQQLLSFLINLSIEYQRWPSMSIIAQTLNRLVKNNCEQYKMFIYTHKSQLKDMQPNLTNNASFDNQIRLIIG